MHGGKKRGDEEDGSAKFKSVQEAIMSVPIGSPTNPIVIHIKPGVYKELLYIQREKRFFNLIGDDAKTTILTCDLHANLTNFDGKTIGTFRTPSTTIDADDFTAENLTFENSAGSKGQALAIRVDGDRATFRKGLPPRSLSSAVITATAPQSAIRPARLSGENPPNTTE